MAADVTVAAASNAAGRRAEAASAIAADDSGRLARFRQVVAQSVFSTNVDAYKVLVFGAAGQVLDARAIETRRRGGNRAAALRAFRRRQGRWLRPRQGFEDLWKHGRRFVYGAVNAGGMGTEAFGAFCLVAANPQRPVPDALAVFPGNSAKRYDLGGGTVDGARATSEATSWADRAELATMALGAEAVRVPSAHWPAVVCRPDDYLEVVRAGAFPPQALTEVRLRAAYHDDLEELRRLYLAGERLTSDQENQVAAYDVLHGWRRTAGMAIRPVV